MSKSINLTRQQDVLNKVTGGKNIPPAALPNETLIATGETTTRTGTLEEAIAAAKAQLNVPIDAPPRAAFVPPEPVPIESLSPTKLAEIQEAISAFSKPAEPVAAPAVPAVSAPPQPETPKNSTGAFDPIAVCPRCAWDLKTPVGPEPEYFDKLKFVTTMLANKPFQKQYELFNGELIVTFRSLRPKEIDACYSHIVYDMNEGKIKFQGDIYEMVNRYRFYLQLVELKTKTGEGMSFEFPDGFTPRTNPKATAFWELPEDLPENSQGLDIVEDYITTEVLTTESLHRVVAATCRDFNRLVAQLEAMVDNANFWKPTEMPS
jgi:hypothetical protein